MSKKVATTYAVYLHPHMDYWQTSPAITRRPSKKFKKLEDALKWCNYVTDTHHKRKRPWNGIQILGCTGYNTIDLLYFNPKRF